MKKTMFSILMLAIAIGLISCNNSVLKTNLVPCEQEDVVETPEKIVIIGDEIIYGDSFSFEELYSEFLECLEDISRSVAARTSEESDLLLDLSDDDFVEMVYFSVHPTTTESLKLVNDTLGYLNPAELDKEIIQACDAEKIIFKDDVVLTEDTNTDEIVNFDVKYYYVTTREIAFNLSSILENYEEIETFETLSQEAIIRLQDEYQEYLDLYGDDLETDSFDGSERGVFKKLFKVINKAVTTVVEAVKTFVVTTYEIKGSISYQVDGTKFPAYGINVRNLCLSENNTSTKENGSFSLGSYSNAVGLCSIWIDYSNSACSLSNFLDVTASTLVRTDVPSNLTNISIYNYSGYSNAKMAVCADFLLRYKDESTRHSGIPKAYVWTTELGGGASSAPCFRQLGSEVLPDIILTGLDSINTGRLETLHHEYTHFLHCVYAGNKNNFWNSVVESEIKCTVYTKISDFIRIINDYVNTDSFVNGTYDFTNPYVCFAENLAEWYSYVGCYGVGVLRKKRPAYGSGKIFNTKVYVNTKVFSELICLLYNDFDVVDTKSKYQMCAIAFIAIIDKYDITTFDEFYRALVKEFPQEKTKIQSLFEDNNIYHQYGNKSGNVISY